jgi:hypothetical protein
LTRRLEIEVTRSGLVEFLYYAGKRESETPFLFLTWFLGLVCNALVSAHKYRVAAGAPSAEIAVAAEVHVGINSIGIPRLGDTNGLDLIGSIPRGAYRFPRYSLGDMGEMQALTNELVRDLANAASEDFDVNLEIDFEDQLRSLQLT